MFRLSIAPVRICQIPHVSFEMKIQFLSKFCITLQSYQTTPLYFFSSNVIYIGRREPIKVSVFETFECSVQNLSNSSCQFWNDKSIPYQILHHSWVLSKLTPLYLFSSNNIYFAQKDPFKVKTLETFECSGQNLSNASCQFWNDKLIRLQNFHHSSLPWHMTPL